MRVNHNYPVTFTIILRAWGIRASLVVTCLFAAAVYQVLEMDEAGSRVDAVVSCSTSLDVTPHTSQVMLFDHIRDQWNLLSSMFGIWNEEEFVVACKVMIMVVKLMVVAAVVLLICFAIFRVMHEQSAWDG